VVVFIWRTVPSRAVVALICLTIDYLVYNTSTLIILESAISIYQSISYLSYYTDWWWNWCWLHLVENTTQSMTCPSEIKCDPRAIINVTITITGSCNLFTLWTGHVPHHHGLIRFQVSDRNLSSILQKWSCEVWS